MQLFYHSATEINNILVWELHSYNTVSLFRYLLLWINILIINRLDWIQTLFADVAVLLTSSGQFVFTLIQMQITFKLVLMKLRSL